MEVIITNKIDNEIIKSFTIVIVEDDEGLSYLISKKFKAAGFKTQRFFRGEDLISNIDLEDKPLLILDYQLPDMTGKEAVVGLTKKLSKTPDFIIMTGFGDEKIAVDLMKIGARDYVIKEADFIEPLIEKVKQTCVLIEEQNKHAEAERALKESEQKYRHLFEKMVQGVVYQNEKGEIISANPAAEYILGLSYSQMVGTTSMDLRWKAVDESMKELSGEEHPAMVALSTGKSVDNFLMGIFNPRKGAYTWIIVNSIPQFRNGQSKPYQVFSTFLDVTQRIVQEKEIRKQRELLLETGQMAKVGGWEVNLKTNKVWWSEVTREIHEVPSDYQPSVEEATDFFGVESQIIIKNAIDKAINNGIPYNLELTLNTAKGNTLWTHAMGNPEMQDGKCIRLHGTFQDITERKTAEEKLKSLNQQLHASEQQLRSTNQQLIANEQQLLAANQQLTVGEKQLRETNNKLLESKQKAEENHAMLMAALEHSQAGIAIADVPSGKLKFVNRAGLMVPDKDYDQFVGNIDVNKYLASWNILHFDGTPYKTDEVPLTRAVLYGETNSREYIIRRDNCEDRYVWANAAPIMNDQGKQIAAIVISLDITKRTKYIEELKETKAQVERSEQELKLLFDNMHQGFALHKMLYDEKGVAKGFTFERVSPAYEKITQRNISDHLGKNVYEVFPGSDKKWLSFFEEVVQQGKETQLEYYDKYVKKHYLLNAFRPKENYFAVLLTDITSLKDYQKKLVKAKNKAEEADRLKSSFLANMSHEIRTPMNSILGFSELLKEPDLSSEEMMMYLNIIENSGARMLDTINDLIDISKIETNQVELNIQQVDIIKEIEEQFDIFVGEAQVRGLQLKLENKLPPDNRFMKTDLYKLHAIMTNLIKNAIKYTDKGLIEIGIGKVGGIFQIYVKDTGIGIPKEKHEAIFDRFVQAAHAYSRPTQGSGLGLSITKAYVKMLGGKIKLKSKIGVGSTFSFTLPESMGKKES